MISSIFYHFVQIIWIIASFPGPVPVHEIGSPTFSSINLMYSNAYFGNSSFLLIFDVSFCHPLTVSYSTSTRENSSRDPGMLFILFPFNLYPTPTFISGKVSRMSNFVKFKESWPLIMLVYRIRFKSSHPQRLGRPVVVPNSKPLFRRSSPVSSCSSVGKGPSPTLVV